MTVTFKLPDLPYDHGALEPHISRTTMETHHGKHHAAYIKNMNAILAERADAPGTLEEVVLLAEKEGNKKLFNNAAQSWNHAFFWESLSPSVQDGPTGDLKAAIEKAFGSVSAFNDEAKSKGAGHFASGWLWLVADKNGAVKLIDTHDAETAITDSSVTPLLVCDVWEHAYYLDYKNERPKFLDAFVSKLANWRFAEAQFAAARSGSGAWVFPT